MKNEYKSLVEKKVWSIVKKDEKQMGSTWHSGSKFVPYFEICLCRACFVAKNFKQIFGKYFYETYSPKTTLSTIQMFMCLAVSNIYQLQQMNTKLLI